MSVESLAIALHHSRAKSATSKLVLLGIANHDGDGGSWPSVATLAHYARCSTRTVQRSVDELERLGEIRRIVQAGGTRHTSDHRRPNLYEWLLRCPPDCDRTAAHRTRRNAGPSVDLDGIDDGSEGVTPVSPQLSTGVTRVSPHRVTRVSPEPPLEATRRSGFVDQPQTARETWTHACLGGTMTEHQLSRKTGACAFCGATRIRYSLEG